MYSFAETGSPLILMAKPGWRPTNVSWQIKSYEYSTLLVATPPTSYDLSGLPYDGGVGAEASTDLKDEWQSLIDAQNTTISDASTAVTNAEIVVTTARAAYEAAAAALEAAPELSTAELDAAGLEVDRAGINLAYQNKFGNADAKAAALERVTTANAAYSTVAAAYNTAFLGRESLQANVESAFGGWAATGTGAADRLAAAQDALASAQFYLTLLQANQNAAPESEPSDGSPLPPYVAFGLESATQPYANHAEYTKSDSMGYPETVVSGTNMATCTYRAKIVLGASEIQELRNAGVTDLKVTWYEVIRTDASKEQVQSFSLPGGGTRTLVHHAPDPSVLPTFAVTRKTETLSLSAGTCLTDEAAGGSLILTGDEHSASVEPGTNNYRAMTLCGGYYLPTTQLNIEVMEALARRVGWCETTTDGEADPASVQRFLVQTASNGPGVPEGVTYSGSKTIAPIPVTVPSTPANVAHPPPASYAGFTLSDTLSTNTRRAAQLQGDAIYAHDYLAASTDGVSTMTGTVQNVVDPAGLKVTLSSELTTGQLEGSVAAWLARSWDLPPQFPTADTHDRLRTVGRINSADGNLRTAQRARYKVDFLNLSPGAATSPYRVKRTTRNIDTGEATVDYIALTYDRASPPTAETEWQEVAAPDGNRTILLEGTSIEDSEGNAEYRAYWPGATVEAVFLLVATEDNRAPPERFVGRSGLERLTMRRAVWRSPKP